MKKIFSVFGVLLVALTMMVGCEKEYSQETGGQFGGTQGSFRAQIDGEQWIATQVKSASRMNDVIVLVGSSEDGKSITLRVADSGVHNYMLHNTSMDNVGVFMDSAVVPYAAFTTNQWLVDSLYGNVNITAIDTVRKTMSGNFQMRVFRQLDGLKRTITLGEFTNISYATTPPPPSAADTFRVKVNNVDFSYNSLTAMPVLGNLMINATQGGNETVGLSFPDNIAPGTYAIDMVAAQGVYNPDASTFTSATTGTLTILEHNTGTNRIRGTFSFTADDLASPLPTPYQLTEGYFSLSY